MQKIYQKAFTLVEISIILVIIGLMAYGIMSGNTIINRARVIKMRDQTKSFSSLSFNKDLVFWIESSMPKAYEISDGGVITVNDRAVFDGASNDAVAPSSAGSPTYTEDVINSLPAFYFDGSSDYLSVNTVSFYSQLFHTVFFVILADSAASSDAIYGFNNGSSDIEVMEANSSSITVTTSGGSTTLYSGTVGGNAVVGAFTTNGSTFTFYKDGTSSYNSANTSLPAYSNAFYVGRETGGDYFKGYIGEILIYQKALSSSERQEVEEYLMGKWKIE
jgi:hypothetical protein